MRRVYIMLVCCVLLVQSCRGPGTDATDVWRKIEIDPAELDGEGLRGGEGGKTAVSYEFRIPDTPECREQVKRIDPTVQFMPGSRGRIGAREHECLCIGSTHQKDYAGVLRALAGLSCVERIIECHFE